VSCYNTDVASSGDPATRWGHELLYHTRDIVLEAYKLCLEKNPEKQKKDKNHLFWVNKNKRQIIECFEMGFSIGINGF
jgi:hypothetical protein